MTGEDDGERDATDAESPDHAHDEAPEHAHDEGPDHEQDDGAAAVEDRDPDAAVGSSREPLGDLRERVVDDDGTGPSGASFPGDASATADGSESTGAEANADADAHANADAEPDPTVPETGRDGPLGELAAGIDGRRERKTKADEDLFDEVEVGDVDADELWSQVESDGPTVEPRGNREVREVEKRKYCSQCPYFSEPPEVACSHEGTDILQQVDMEHFEVADCPVVLEDERLEDVTTE